MKRWLVLGPVLVGAALLTETIAIGAQNHPWRVAIVGAIAFAVAGVGLLLFSNRVLTAAVALLFGAWGYGLIDGLDARDHELGYYCRYGADSQAELDSCMESVDTGEIEELDTPAARFARDETNACGPGSGRFCAGAARDKAP